MGKRRPPRRLPASIPDVALVHTGKVPEGMRVRVERVEPAPVPARSAVPVSPPAPVVDRAQLRATFVDVVAELSELDAHRAAVLARRDALSSRLHVAGYSWVELAHLAGTSRQALMKRV